MRKSFYKQDIQVLKFDIVKDIDLIRFDHYIKQKENFQRIKEELPIGQFYMTIRNVSLDLDITFNKSQRIIKKFEDLNIIRCVFKSKNNKKDLSIYEYVSMSSTQEHSNNATLEVPCSTDNVENINNIKSSTHHSTHHSTDSSTQECSNNATLDISSSTHHSTDSSTHRSTSKIDNKIDNINNIYIGVVSYLNKKIGSSYKINTKATQKLIDARLKEGYTLENFKTVIDIKSGEWLNDAVMSKYLRPETLFSNKFEGYLNQQVSLLPKTKPIEKPCDYKPFDFSCINGGAE